MSKRKTDVQGGRLDGFEGDGSSDIPMETQKRATAAQMANRKIKGAKGARRPPGPSNSLFSINNAQSNQQSSQIPFGGVTQNGFNSQNADSNAQQQQPAFSFGQQVGSLFGTSQSFPPNHASPSSPTQQGSQSASFGGIGNSNNGGFSFIPPSSGFSFSPSSGSNPFSSSVNDANTTSTTLNNSSGFKGSIFSFGNSADTSANSSPHLAPIAATPFSFGQTNETHQSHATSNLFGPSSSQAQQPPAASSLFEPSNAQQPGTSNGLFGHAANFSNHLSQASNGFTPGEDSMQTSPDNSPSKNEGARPSPFSFSSQRKGPEVGKQTMKTPVSQPSFEGSQPPKDATTSRPGIQPRDIPNGLFSTISRPQTNPSSPSLLNRSEGVPNELSESNMKASAPADTIKVFGKGSPNGPPHISANDPVPQVSEQSAETSSVVRNNPFAGLKVPTSLSAASPLARPEDSNTELQSKAESIFESPTTTFQKSSPLVPTIKASSSPSSQSAYLNTLLSAPIHFSDAQKQQYTMLVCFRSLSDGFKEKMITVADHEDISVLAEFYLDRREDVIGTAALPQGDIAKGKKLVFSDESSAAPARMDKNARSDHSSPVLFTTTQIASGEGGQSSQIGAGPALSENVFGSRLSASGDSGSSVKRKANENHAQDENDGDSNAGKKSKSADTVSYPSFSFSNPLQEGSQTSSIFKDIVNKADQEDNATNVWGSNLLSSKPVPTTTGRISSPTSANAFTFTPKTASSATSNGFSLPTFKANASSNGSVNFLAQFGQSAEENAEKEKEKRKAEEFDSDDDNEIEWERKDAEEQRAKKQKLAEISKRKTSKFVPGEGFVFEAESSTGVKGGSEEGNKGPASIIGSDSSKSSANASSGLFTSGSSDLRQFTSGGTSIFDTTKPLGKQNALNIASNIFSHLSDAESGAEGSKMGDADDEDTASGEESEDGRPKDQYLKPPKATPLESANPTNEANSTINRPFETQDNDSLTGKPVTLSANSISSLGQTVASGRSIFDRMSKDSDGNALRESSTTGDKKPDNPFQDSASPTSLSNQASPSSTSNIFDQNSTAPLRSFKFGSSTSQAGDHTWKQDSPIKFGSSAAPTFSFNSPTPTKNTSSNEKNTASKPFANLFGAPKPVSDGRKDSPIQTSSTLFGPPSAKPADVGFTFGGPPKSISSTLLAPSALVSAGNSRATSPGATTDTGGESAAESAVEGTEGENGGHAQQLDLTSGGPGEEDENVLFKVNAKILLNDGGKYESKGVGPLRVLKHKESGKSRILLRANPSGKVILNATLLSGVQYINKPPKHVSVPVATDDGKLKTFFVKVGKDEDALRLAEILEEQKST
ncbi:MAG: hypothetical protein M1827_001300 [Pycnora praestabilis]|nr:MAG: hypothetical protein M1827_001300 [Pycnora praestabilis]